MNDNTQSTMLEELESLLLGDGKESEKKVEPSQVKQDENDAIFQALQPQMPKLMDTSAWKGLSAELRCKLLEAHVKSAKKVSVPKPLQPEDPSTSRNSNLKSIEMVKKPALSVAVSTQRYYNDIGGKLQLNDTRFRHVYLYNMSNQRLAFQIQSSQVDPHHRSNNWKGFILPNSQVVSTIWFNKRNYNQFTIGYEPSDHYDIASCFKSEKSLPGFIITL